MKTNLVTKSVILSFLFALSFLNHSCKKKDGSVSIFIEKSIVIPSAGDIKHFSFPTNNVGYAGDASGKVFKTVDGGAFWETVKTGPSCNGVEFVSPEKGFVLMGNSVFYTIDRGATWTYLCDGSFLGMTNDGNIVVGEYIMVKCKVKVYDFSSSAPVLTLDTLFFNDNLSTWSTDKGMVVNNHVFVLSGSEDNFDSDIYGYDLTDEEAVQIFSLDVIAIEYPNAVYCETDESDMTFVGGNGMIADRYDRYSEITKKELNSIDKVGGVSIAVGDGVILTDYEVKGDSKWKYLLNDVEQEFPYTFFKVKGSSSNKFYISGNKGILWLASVKPS